MINVRKATNAFSPYAHQQVLNLDKRVFAVRRKNADTGSSVVAVANVTNKPIQLNTTISGKDLLTSKQMVQKLELGPYEYAWIDEQ